MKILFNKAGSEGGAKEVKSLIGYVDKDLNFDNIQADIITSTYDVISLIGKEVYQKAEDVYYAEAESNADLLALHKAFVRAVRYPIAVNGYRLFAPSNDLSHTNNGRKMRNDDASKAAFEWMIDRDNIAQEKRYYRALDDLILLLDNLQLHVLPVVEDDEQPATFTSVQQFENELYNTWKNSDAYKATYNLFLRTVNEFDACFPINSRLLFVRLMPGMEECETDEILPRIGAEKYAELKALLLNRQTIPDTDKQLLKEIRKAMAAAAMAWAFPRFSVNLFPDGVLQHYTSDRATTRGQKPALNLEPEAARMVFRNAADKALLKIEQLLAPEPDADDCTEVIPRGCKDDKYFSTF